MARISTLMLTRHEAEEFSALPPRPGAAWDFWHRVEQRLNRPIPNLVQVSYSQFAITHRLSEDQP